MPIKNYFRGSDYFNQPDELKNLSPEEVYKMIDEYKIIDVRTKFEYKRGHIKNAVNYKLGSERNIVETIAHTVEKPDQYTISIAATNPIGAMILEYGSMNVLLR